MSTTNSEENENEENKCMENYSQNFSYYYNTLLYVFQYLEVPDLLRAGRVCTIWRDIASHPMFWKTVTIKDVKVSRFEGLVTSLEKGCTKYLDLGNLQVSKSVGLQRWCDFSQAIEKVDTLERIELCRCPSFVVEKLAVSNSYLEVLNARNIYSNSINLEPLKALKNIKELRLKSNKRLVLSSNINSLRVMKGLKHLSLTSIVNLNGVNLDHIAELTNLESLALGDCLDLNRRFIRKILIKLTNLEKLRLERGNRNCNTVKILEAVKQMVRLEVLELVRFKIKLGFDRALGECQNIKKLLIIPTYYNQCSLTNNLMIVGVSKLKKLTHFTWGMSSDLMVNSIQMLNPHREEANNEFNIPLFLPLTFYIIGEGRVEFITLTKLHELLIQKLPSARIKVVRGESKELDMLRIE